MTRQMVNRVCIEYGVQSVVEWVNMCNQSQNQFPRYQHVERHLPGGVPMQNAQLAHDAPWSITRVSFDGKCAYSVRQLSVSKTPEFSSSNLCSICHFSVVVILFAVTFISKIHTEIIVGHIRTVLPK